MTDKSRGDLIAWLSAHPDGRVRYRKESSPTIRLIAFRMPPSEFWCCLVGNVGDDYRGTHVSVDGLADRIIAEEWEYVEDGQESG